MELLKWHDPTLSYYTLMIIGIIMYILIFKLDYLLPEKYLRKVHNYTEECIIGCSDKDTCDYVNKFRNDGYYLFDNDANEKCIVTKWEISHFLTHLFLGYFTNLYISLAVGFGFEIYEYKFYDCGSYIDILYNTAGFLTGFYLKHGIFI